MKLLSLIPTVFYSDIRIGIQLFVDGLGFAILHNDTKSSKPFCIVGKDGMKIYLVQDAESVGKDRPEIRIETDDIETLHKELCVKHSELLHPNLKEIKQQPWGLKEFALLDSSGVCVIIQQ